MNLFNIILFLLIYVTYILNNKEIVFISRSDFIIFFSEA